MGIDWPRAAWPRWRNAQVHNGFNLKKIGFVGHILDKDAMPIELVQYPSFRLNSIA